MKGFCFPGPTNNSAIAAEFSTPGLSFIPRSAIPRASGAQGSIAQTMSQSTFFPHHGARKDDSEVVALTRQRNVLAEDVAVCFSGIKASSSVIHVARHQVFC